MRRASILGTVLVSGFLFFVLLSFFRPITEAETGPASEDNGNGLQFRGSGLNLSGYAWSSGLGWISFGNGDYDSTTHGVYLGPVVDDSGSQYRYLGDSIGVGPGYAWSSSVGWIKFDPNFADSPTDFPSASNDYHGARMDVANGTFSGWARACGVFQTGCSGALKSASELGGWDGWVKFSGATGGPGSYVARSHDISNPDYFDNSSYIWGGNDIVGWISLCNNPPTADNGPISYCVRIGSPFGASCSYSPNAPYFEPESTGNRITWHTDVAGGIAPFTYVWSGDINNGPTGVASSNTSYDYDDTNNNCGSEEGTYSKIGHMAVTDNTGTTAYCSRTVTVTCGGTPPDSNGGTGEISDPDPAIIRITSQPLTSPAISSATSLYNQDTNNDTNLFIVSTQSTISPSDSLSEASFGDVQCRLSHTPISEDPNPIFGSCGNGTSIQLGTTNPNATAYFNIRVNQPVANLNSLSPYEIILSGSSTCSIPHQANCSSVMKSFLFDYAVSTVSPI